MKAAGLLLAASGGAWAGHGENGAPAFSLHGFGTVAAVRSSERNADFASSILKPNGPGHTRRWSMDPDSRLGVQLTAHWTERWSSVLQLVSEQRYDDSYRPRVEWANVQFKLTEAASMRVGRIALPAFLAGDYRKVGYAMPWLRPPGEVYDLLPMTSNDGFDAIYRIASGSARHELQFFSGSMDTKERSGASAEARNVVGLAHRIEAGGWTTQLLYQQAQLTIERARPLFNAFRQFGSQGNAIADHYDSNQKRYRVATLGATYDSGAWFVTGEVARSWTHSWVGDRTGWYLGGGYTFGKFTPYLVLAAVRSNIASSASGLDTSGMPAVSAEAAARLNQGLNALLASPEQKTVSLGVRWELVSDVALKVQYDYTDMAAGSPGPLINLQSAFRPGGKLKLFSVALDFVF